MASEYAPERNDEGNGFLRKFRKNTYAKTRLTSPTIFFTTQTSNLWWNVAKERERERERERIAFKRLYKWKNDGRHALFKCFASLNRTHESMVFIKLCGTFDTMRRTFVNRMLHTSVKNALIDTFQHRCQIIVWDKVQFACSILSWKEQIELRLNSESVQWIVHWVCTNKRIYLLQMRASHVTHCCIENACLCIGCTFRKHAIANAHIVL